MTRDALIPTACRMYPGTESNTGKVRIRTLQSGGEWDEGCAVLDESGSNNDSTPTKDEKGDQMRGS